MENESKKFDLEKMLIESETNIMDRTVFEGELNELPVFVLKECYKNNGNFENDDNIKQECEKIVETYRFKEKLIDFDQLYFNVLHLKEIKSDSLIKDFKYELNPTEEDLFDEVLDQKKSVIEEFVEDWLKRVFVEIKELNITHYTSNYSLLKRIDENLYKSLPEIYNELFIQINDRLMLIESINKWTQLEYLVCCAVDYAILFIFAKTEFVPLRDAIIGEHDGISGNTLDLFLRNRDNENILSSENWFSFIEKIQTEKSDLYKKLIDDDFIWVDGYYEETINAYFEYLSENDLFDRTSSIQENKYLLEEIAELVDIRADEYLDERNKDNKKRGRKKKERRTRELQRAIRDVQKTHANNYTPDQIKRAIKRL